MSLFLRVSPVPPSHLLSILERCATSASSDYMYLYSSQLFQRHARDRTSPVALRRRRPPQGVLERVLTLAEGAPGPFGFEKHEPFGF
jgi:hypothetical protein